MRLNNTQRIIIYLLMNFKPTRLNKSQKIALLVLSWLFGAIYSVIVIPAATVFDILTLFTFEILAKALDYLRMLLLKPLIRMCL